jgi:hypothetical protein
MANLFAAKKYVFPGQSYGNGVMSVGDENLSSKGQFSLSPPSNHTRRSKDDSLSLSLFLSLSLSLSRSLFEQVMTRKARKLYNLVSEK